jgi:hypothetical protein
MSFFGVFILLMVLGGLVLLVLYSLLAMAAKGDEYDEYLDQLELEQYPVREYAPLSPKGENQRTSVCRPPPICPTVTPPKLGFSSNVESAKTLVGVRRLRFPLIRQGPGLRWGKPG